MNINLSTVTDSPKTTSIATDGNNEVSEEASAEGFFAKLSSLIKGESSADDASVNADQTDTLRMQAVAESSEDGEAVNKSASAENAAVDELLSEESDLLVDDEEGEKKASVLSEQEVSSRSNARAQANEEPEVVKESSRSTQAEKIIADNEQVLKRLDQSNSALQNQNGKALPQANGVDESQHRDVELTHEQPSSPLANSQGELAVTEGDNKHMKVSAANLESRDVQSENVEEEVDLAKIPASAKPFIEVNQTVDSDGELVESKPASASAVDSANSVVGTELKVDNQGVIAEDASITGISTDSARADLIDEKTSEDPDAASLYLHDTHSSSTEPAPLVSAMNVSASKSSLQAEGEQRATVANVSDLDSQVAKASANAAELAADTTLAAGMTATAIPWATSSDDVVIADDIVLQAQQHSKAQQAAVAQSVHQALTQQQAVQVNSASPLNSPNAINADVTASQLQAMAHSATSAPVNIANHSIATEQAMLKAAMGAKSVGALANGKVTQTESSQTGESGLAQQLSHAAGVSQTTGLQNGVRAEQATQQVPLQLHRDIAGEQVAERVQMMLSKNLKNIDIRLDPPELGRMQIRMNMNGDGATVHFTVANQQARDALEQSMPRLREMLAQQGVQLGDTSVQQQANGQQQNRYAAGGQGESGQGSSNQAQLGEENLEPDINLDLNVAAKRDGISYYA